MYRALHVLLATSLLHCSASNCFRMYSLVSMAAALAAFK
jgi:hypothetical protein